MGNWLSVVDNKKQYLERLRAAVEHMHKCVAVHSETIPVQEVFQGKTVWQGDVERFLLLNHPKATVAYAWSDKEGERDGGERFVAVLELPPGEFSQESRSNSDGERLQGIPRFQKLTGIQPKGYVLFHQMTNDE